uniref:Alpha-mannosidase n=3 Tax=Hirondellea gigas TaxID=1518452 RepID=A0A6A7G152_9CRUS
MRLHASIVFGAAICLATLLLLYQLVSLPPDNNIAIPNQSYNALENRLKRLEQDISANHDTVQEIHGLLKKIGGTGNNSPVLHPRMKPVDAILAPQASDDAGPVFNTSVARLLPDDCNFSQAPASSVDILMENVYKSLPFDNPDGGAWKQGWEVTYESTQWSPERLLRIFVVPHSHNDPGWIKTFERYYQDQTSHILDNMARKLPEDPRRKFIWAEISFFSMWWHRQTPSVQDTVRGLLSRGQLEIVSGGWVMPDESGSHYWAIIDQLVTGHEWLREHLNVRPNNGWAIDPFGLSPTMAYILKRSGFDNMLIQRSHYALKKHLAASTNLEFRWRQAWDPDSSTDILCHMMPFYSYDVPHTCGPDPKVCCQFDFKRLPGSRVTCPWRVAPQPITQHNVQDRSALLLDQYRKKSQLYRTNVLLVPLGDDFRYDTAEEWDNQFLNYQLLFDHMNARSDNHVQAQFGTLADYFQALREESRTSQQQQGNAVAAGEEDEEALFPSLAGDFFTYADKDDNYWSGYFTSRPYYKARSRLLAHKIRAAEILFNLAVGSSGATDPAIPHNIAEQLHLELTEAHKALGLFQHHDGITGTAKDHVVLDYANKLLDGIHHSEHVTQFAAHSLIAPKSDQQSAEMVFFEVSEVHEGASVVSVPRVLHLGEPGRGAVILYNSHPHTYRGLATVRIDSPYIKVVNGSGRQVKCQVDPVFDGLQQGELFDVRFPVELKPLSLSRFVITRKEQPDLKFVTYATVIVKNEELPTLPTVFSVQSYSTDMPLVMQCGGSAAVSIGDNGLLESVTSDGVTYPLLLQFVSYRARETRETSGAYLFLPKGEAEVLVNEAPPTKVVSGPLHAILTTKLPLLTHTLSIANSPGLDSEGLTVRNLVNVRRERNFELAMRLVSDIDSQDTFYTDLNGFQMVRRIRESKLTLQGNYYPVASQAFIQDSTKRLTLLTGQPHGGSSLASGQIEVMQDRRLMQDDFRGVEQGVTDNVVTPNVFRILLERRLPGLDSSSGGARVMFPSLLAERSLHELLFPTVMLHHTYKASGLLQSWSVGSGTEVPCDVQLVSLRSIRGGVGGGAAAGAAAALTLRRGGIDCSFPPPRVDCATNGGKVQLNDILGGAFNEEVRQSTLSHLYAGVNITKSFTLTLQPMELYTFLLSPSPRSPIQGKR